MSVVRFYAFLWMFASVVFLPVTLFAENVVEWGGKVKLSQTALFPQSGGFNRLAGAGAHESLSAGEIRLTNKLNFSDTLSFQTHYQLIGITGNAVKNHYNAARQFPGFAAYGTAARNTDAYRLMDLTSIIDSDENSLLYHRIDRLFAAFQTDEVTLRIGRQAVTWGNGLIFNPLDLVNPFAPTDIEREYKVGDDMFNLLGVLGGGLEVQAIYVPRRKTPRGDVDWDSSSTGTRVQVFSCDNEYDFVYARHYGDDVVGVGGSGNLINAAWRFDIMCTFPHHDEDAGAVFSFVLNIDYSWMWGGKNWYGLLEFYHNGFGTDNYADALVDEDLAKRIGRGDVFVLGRDYLGATLQYEATPLVNVYFTSIVNLTDPSAVLQPRVVWDVAQWARLTFGAALNCGAHQTEFGGFKTDTESKAVYGAGDSVFVWFDVYF